MIKNYLKRLKIRKIKKIMRGRNKLIKENNLNLLNDIKLQIENIDLVPKNYLYNLFIGNNIDINRSFIQYLKFKIYDRNLNSTLQLYQIDKKPIIYPLPKKLFKILEANNIKVNKTLSSLMYFFFSIKSFLKGHFFFYKFFFISLIKKNNLNKNCYYFCNIENEIFKYKNLSEFSIFNILNNNSLENINIAHDCKNNKKINFKNSDFFYAKYPFPLISNFLKLVLFILQYLKFVFFSLFSIIIKDLAPLILFEEFIKFSIIKYSDENKICSKYFFNNSIPVYRPIWTYEAELKNSKIYFYFYSTNNKFINASNKYNKKLSWWINMTWPTYLVWNKEQEKFVKQCAIGYQNIKIVGPIINSSYTSNFKIAKKNIITIFDIQPFRASLYKDSVHLDNYYQPPISNLFISDIINSKLNNEYSFYLKPKRDIKNRINPVYKNFIDNLKKSNSLEIYNFDDSLKDILENSKIIISMPYTSVAFVGKFLNTKSIYYDPTKSLSYDEISSGGVPLISGKNNLQKWLFQNS